MLREGVKFEAPQNGPVYSYCCVKLEEQRCYRNWPQASSTKWPCHPTSASLRCCCLICFWRLVVCRWCCWAPPMCSDFSSNASSDCCNTTQNVLPSSSSWKWSWHLCLLFQVLRKSNTFNKDQQWHKSHTFHDTWHRFIKPSDCCTFYQQYHTYLISILWSNLLYLFRLEAHDVSNCTSSQLPLYCRAQNTIKGRCRPHG